MHSHAATCVGGQVHRIATQFEVQWDVERRQIIAEGERDTE